MYVPLSLPPPSPLASSSLYVRTILRTSGKVRDLARRISRSHPGRDLSSRLRFLPSPPSSPSAYLDRGEGKLFGGKCGAAAASLLLVYGAHETFIVPSIIMTTEKKRLPWLRVVARASRMSEGFSFISLLLSRRASQVLPTEPRKRGRNSCNLLLRRVGGSPFTGVAAPVAAP